MKVLMVGPDRSVQGGISGAVNIWYEAGLDKKIELKYIGTMVDGSIIRKALKALQSYIIFPFLVGKCDIVHVNMASDNSYYRKLFFVKSAKRHKKKLVIHQHGGDVENFFVNNANDKKRRKFRKYLNNADAFLVIAPIWKDFFAPYVDEHKIHVLPNGVTLAEYEVNEKDYNNHNIGYIGRLCNEKGIRELYESIEQLSEKYPDIHLYTGGKWEDFELKDWQDNHTELSTHYGWLDEKGKAEMLKKCSIFAMPSYFEGQCIAVLEAMEYGCATIATKVGGLQQTFDDGVDGILIKEKSTDALRDAIESLLSNDEERVRIGKEGRRKVESRFDVNVIVDELIEIYNNV